MATINAFAFTCIVNVSCVSMNVQIPYGPEGKPWVKTLSSLATSKTSGCVLVSPPSKDPATVYDFRDEPVTSNLYQVPSSGLTKEQRSRALAETSLAINVSQENALGYRCSFRDHANVGAGLQDSFITAHLNNGGSPFVASYSGLSTLWMERNVLDYYASLWNAKWPHDPNDPESYWGYVLTMGSTEGNLHALWNARNYLSGKYTNACGSHDEKSKSAMSNYHYKQCVCPADNPNALSPVVFYSCDAHYSNMKASEAMSVPSFHEVGVKKYPEESPIGQSWPLAVPCTGGDSGPGTIDVDALCKLVDFFSGKGHPIIVVFSYGTTSKGAYDDVKAAGEALVPILRKNGMYERKLYCHNSSSADSITRKGFWFHVDGALGAAYAPFLQMAYENGLTELQPPPVFDFRLNFVSSIVTSGHKFIGVPWPCGVYVSKTEFQLRSPDKAHIPYIESPDLTLAGSRNAHSVIALWSYISTYSYEEQAKRAVDALKAAIYTENKLKELEKEIKRNLCVMHSQSSLAVSFKRPNEKISRKFSLCGNWLHIDGEVQHCVHIYTIDGDMRLSKIDELIESLHSQNAFEGELEQAPH